MPYADRRQHARRSRFRHRRLAVLLGSATLFGLMTASFIWPSGPASDLTGSVGGQAAGQEPTDEASPSVAPVVTPIPALVAVASTPTPTPMRTPAPLPTPVPTPPLTALATPVPSATPLATPDPTPPAIETLTGYVWPLAHPRLTQGFGPAAGASRIVNGKGFHDGADLATFCGDRIKAAHAGKVLAAGRRYDEHIGWVGDLGPYLRRLDKQHLWHQLPIVVVIDDGNGYRSMYAHFSRVVVKAGQEVKAGQLLGFEGATGRASGCHLHYGLYSPFETKTIAIRSDVVRRMKLPKAEVARIDPLLVLPPKRGINAPKVPKAAPSPTPSP